MTYKRSKTLKNMKKNYQFFKGELRMHSKHQQAGFLDLQSTWQDKEISLGSAAIAYKQGRLLSLNGRTGDFMRAGKKEHGQPPRLCRDAAT